MPLFAWSNAHNTFRAQLQPGDDRVAIRFGSDQVHQPVIGIAAIVARRRGVITAVVRDNVQVAVIVLVSRGHFDDADYALFWQPCDADSSTSGLWRSRRRARELQSWGVARSESDFFSSLTSTDNRSPQPTIRSTSKSLQHFQKGAESKH
jgi:hypothetical protein